MATPASGMGASTPKVHIQNGPCARCIHWSQDNAQCIIGKAHIDFKCNYLAEVPK